MLIDVTKLSVSLHILFVLSDSNFLRLISGLTYDLAVPYRQYISRSDVSEVWMMLPHYKSITPPQIVDTSSKQSTKHQRHVFLFNDTMIVTKKSGTRYIFKRAINLAETKLMFVQSATSERVYQLTPALDSSLAFKFCFEGSDADVAGFEAELRQMIYEVIQWHACDQ